MNGRMMVVEKIKNREKWMKKEKTGKDGKYMKERWRKNEEMMKGR